MKKGYMAEPPFAEKYDYLVLVWPKPRPGHAMSLPKVHGFTDYQEALAFRLKQYDAKIKKKCPGGHFEFME